MQCEFCPYLFIMYNFGTLFVLVCVTKFFKPCLFTWLFVYFNFFRSVQLTSCRNTTCTSYTVSFPCPSVNDIIHWYLGLKTSINASDSAVLLIEVGIGIEPEELPIFKYSRAIQLNFITKRKNEFINVRRYLYI